jgi:glycosyltransferase involved in cell wall biosynthesis
MQLSIVIPLFNETDSLKELAGWITDVMQKNAISYELLFIDDGSTDDSWNTIEQICAENPQVKALRFPKNFGKSQALHAGFKFAKGRLVATMDADLQDSPEELPEMIRLLDNERYDLVSGWKRKRYDNLLTKNLPSRLFNWAARKSSKIQLHDFNCGLKVYRSEVVKAIDVKGEMHRYIPVLAASAGFTKIGEKPVVHQARKYGITKFGPERFLNGLLDLITISFVSRFGKRPMHLFGAIGVLMFIIGLSFTTYLGVDKLFFNTKARLITERAEFYLALSAMLLGTQLFLAGFLGELVVRSQTDKDRYYISEKINLNIQQ